MSDNLGITRLPQGAETPEVMINAALSEIDAFLSDSVEVNLSAGNANLSIETIKAGNFISLNGAAEARTVLLPQTKRTLFFKNYGTAEVTVTRGTKSVAIPAGQARTMRLTGSENGLEDIGGGGSGGGSAGLPEAPTDGKYYARKSAAWAEVPAAGGSPGVAPNFKIWRLYGTIKPTTNQIGFDTFNVNNAVNGAVTIAVSSTEDGYPASNARPGNPGAWYSAPYIDNNPWIEYTFPEPIDGHSIYLYNVNATYAPATIRLEARNSTSDPWTVVIPDTPHTLTADKDAAYGIPRTGGGGSGGGIEEAPTDGKQYARQNSDWTEVVAGGGGGSLFPIDPPTAAEFDVSWNDGFATVVETSNANFYSSLRTDTGRSSEQSVNFRGKSIANPTGLWTATAVIKAPVHNRQENVTHALGIRCADGQSYFFGFNPSPGDYLLTVLRFYNNAYNDARRNYGIRQTDYLMLRIQKTATHHRFFVSSDYGLNFDLFYEEPQSSFSGSPVNAVGINHNSFGSFAFTPILNRLICPYFSFVEN